MDVFSKSPVNIIVSDSNPFQDIIQTIQSFSNNSKIAIVCDKAIIPFRDEIIQFLSEQKTTIVLSDVKPNPSVDDIMLMANKLKDNIPEIIIGIGGGSTLDSAKALSIVLSEKNDLENYLGANPLAIIKNRNIKLILIPSTAGTGSEVTRFGVYTSRTGRKYSLVSPYLLADVALLIPQLTYGLPPSYTAATAFDALSHTLETLWNKNASIESDNIALEAAANILKTIEISYNSSLKKATEGRKEMLVAACKSGIAFNITGTAAVHAISFILSEEWDIPHGIACAFTLEDILLLNGQNDILKAKIYKLVHDYMNIATSEPLKYLHEYIISLKKTMKLPFTFHELGIEMNEELILPLFDKSLDDFKMKNNLVAVDKNVMYRILRNKF